MPARRVMHVDEIELIDQTRAGDHRAFEELVRRYHSPAWCMAYTLTTDETAADAAVLDAFVAAYRHIGNLAPETGFSAWFYTFVVNFARREARRAIWKRWPPMLAGSSVSARTARNRRSVAERKGEFWGAVCLLPVDLREVVALHYVLDMSEVEMAAVLSLPPNTVKSRVDRARRLLRLWKMVYRVVRWRQ
jgi:RNA polymerase sigma-70 factor, ECF subfamily